MTTALYVFYFIAAFGLLAFGAWITYKGVSFVLTKYDWKNAGQPGQPDRGAMPLESGSFSVNQLLASLNKIVDPAPTPVQPPFRAPTPEGEGEEPETGDAGDETGGESGETGEDKGSTLEGVAKIIEALPNLLKADFGPIVVVCFTGLVVMGGGFTILILVLKAVTG